MKRTIRLIALALLLATLFALPALAEREKSGAKDFTIYDDKRNQVLRVEVCSSDIYDLTMGIENGKKVDKVFSKCKTTVVNEGDKTYLCVIVTPKSTGKVTFDLIYDYKFHALEFSYFTPVTITVKTSKPPVITKQPKGERVAVNGGCTFVAHASDADSVEWFLTNGHDTIRASKGPKRFSGLSVSGYDTDKLVLKKVPESMDGWEVFATFTNENGTTDSDNADIYVYEPLEKESDEPYSAPTPIYIYVTPSPIPTIAPTAYLPVVTPIPTLPVVTPEPSYATADPAATPYNGTKFAASKISVTNAAGREVGLASPEAELVTGNLDGTYVLIDGTVRWLRYVNAYGSWTGTLMPVTAESASATVREATARYAIRWDETPVILGDHTLTASSLEVTSAYGFASGARLLLAFDGRDVNGTNFTFEDHSSGWRYAVEEVLDRPIA